MVCPAQVIPGCEIVVLIVEGFFELADGETVVAIVEVVLGFMEVELGEEALAKEVRGHYKQDEDGSDDEVAMTHHKA
jgi:hypothetical protein